MVPAETLPAAVTLRLSAGKSARPARVQDGTLIRVVASGVDRFTGQDVTLDDVTFRVQRPSHAAPMIADRIVGALTTEGWIADFQAIESGAWIIRCDVALPSPCAAEIIVHVSASQLAP